MSYRVETYVPRERRWAPYGTLQYNEQIAKDLLTEVLEQKLWARMVAAASLPQDRRATL